MKDRQRAREFWIKREKKLIDKLGLDTMLDEKVYFPEEVWIFMTEFHNEGLREELRLPSDEELKKELRDHFDSSFWPLRLSNIAIDDMVKAIKWFVNKVST